MKYYCLSVRDEKVGSFSQPFYAPSLGHGIRSFLDAASRQEPDNMMLKHPEDFVLYHVAEFDDSDGSFKLVSPVVQLSWAVEAFPAKQ